MKTSSIVRRATAMVLAVEFVCGIVLCTTAILHEQHARFHELDEMLRGSTDSLVGAVQDAEDPEDHVTVNPEEFKPRRGDIYVAYSPDHHLIGASSDAAEELQPRPDDGFSALRLSGHNYRVYQRQALRIIDRYETGGAGLRRPFTVVYAMPMDHIWHEILSAARFYVLFSAALLCMTAVLIILLLRRLMRPLGELAASAAAIDERSLHFAPPASSIQLRELRPVTDAISQSIARLRSAFELQRRFISDAAHELKTAVAVVRSSVQVLTMRPRSAEQYQAGLELVLTDNARVEELLARMLTLARFEETAAVGSCPLDAQVEFVLCALQSHASRRGLALRSSCEPASAVSLSADAAQTLISNLIMNAIQHSPQGSEITVRVRRMQPGSNQIVLEVQDFGCGIAPESLPHVFERFFRADPSRSRETGGAGLGLAICKSIVDSAGGEIRIQSAPGTGTLVTALLPAA